MTTIRIADEPHPARQHQSEFDAETGTAGPNASIYEMGRLARSRTNGTDDGIVNIRVRATSRDRRSVSFSAGQDDEDPGLRRPGDYRKAQVCILEEIILRTQRLTRPQGLFWLRPWQACVPVLRCHLWRHWNQSSLCLLVYLYRTSNQAGPHRCPLARIMVLDSYGHGQICPGHPSRRQ